MSKSHPMLLPRIIMGAVLAVVLSSSASAGALHSSAKSQIAQTTTSGVAAGKQGASTTQANGLAGISRLGVNAFALEDSDMQTMKDSGVNFVRVQLYWNSNEPVLTSPPTWVWGYTDQLFYRMALHNLTPLVTVLACPPWACPDPSGPINAANMTDFNTFMSAASARYSQPPYNVHDWELWNEPDGSGGADHMLGWGNHADLYATMLRYAYTAVHANDSQAVVMSGGLAYDNWVSQGGSYNHDFLPAILSSAGQYMDAVAFHYYLNNANGWTNVSVKARDVRAVLNQAGSNLPLICNEAGLTSDPAFNSSEAIQARYIVQFNIYGAASGLAGQMWYVSKDYTDSNPRRQIFTKSGLVRLDGTLKPSYTALSVLQSKIGSAPYLRSLSAQDGLPNGIEGYKFRSPDGNRMVSILWSTAGAAGTVTIPTSQAPDVSGVTDLYGQPIQTQSGTGGTLLLNVGADPVYIDWANRFDDVSTVSWMYNDVEYLASRGIVSGYTDGTFHPEAQASRGQFAKMIVLGVGWPLDTTSAQRFRDVAPGSPFYSYIQTAAAHDAISGYACGGVGDPCPGAYFHPERNISRAQIAKIVVLARGWPLLNPAVPTFSDVPVDSPFYSLIETAHAYGVISGYTNGTFLPNNEATRAQLSKMLAQALQH